MEQKLIISEIKQAAVHNMNIKNEIKCILYFISGNIYFPIHSQ